MNKNFNVHDRVISAMILKFLNVKKKLTLKLWVDILL